MTWDTDLVLMLRVIIGDINTPQTYSDSYLKQVIITSAIQVGQEFPLKYDYTYDIGAMTIVSDPFVNNDSSFIALVPLKAACVLTQGEFKQALGQGIKVRDGDSAIDTSVSFKGYRDILELGPCAAYERLKWSMLASGQSSGGGVGRAVLGPHRLSGSSVSSAISWYYDQFIGSRRNR